MSYLVYLLFSVIFFCEYIIDKIGLKIKLLAILPEIISIIIGAYLLIYVACNKGMKIPLRYVFVFLSLFFHIVIGLIGNQVQPLAIFSGLRLYFNYLPLYFLPMIVDFSDNQISRHLKLLLVIAIIQFPIALYQRFFEFNIYTGDYIAGSLTTAPQLSIFLICAISIMSGFYFKKKLSTRKFVLMLFILFLPTTVNETKATVILLPLALFLPALLEMGKGKRVKIILTVIPAFIIMMIGFHIVYNSLYDRNSDAMEFFTTNKINDYLYKGSQENQISGEEGEVGRVDSIILAYNTNSKNIFRIVWGVGIGNAVASFSKNFQGQYSDEYQRLGGKMTGIAHFIWEIGLLGFIHILILLLMFFGDAVSLRKRSDIVGPIALGWMGVTVIFIITLAYQNILAKNALVFPFLYFSGYLASKKYINKDINEEI